MTSVPPLPAQLVPLADRVAVVIGGTSGLGRAISLALADAGAHVVASSRRAAEVAAVAGEIEARGRRALRATCDATNRASLEQLLAATVAAFGHVDILVCAQGRTQRTATLEVSETEWNDIVDTNLTGTLRACQLFAPCMIERGYGRIVNVASLATFVAFHEVAAYGASKAGVAALTRSLAVEWGQKGICVNAIAPGVVPTALNSHLLEGTGRGRELLARTPMQRFGKPDELGAAMVFLASEGASFVNGQVIAVDGGFLASGVNQ